jgi:hypothetical protein
MFCERCGRFCLFKKMYSDCALVTIMQPPELPRPSAPRFITALATTLGSHIKTSCTMSINVNGKKATFNLGGGITDGLVRQVADQTKLSLEEARALLQAKGSPERLVEVGNQIAGSHHPGTVKCQACACVVPPGRFCSQCGQALVWSSPGQ